MGAVAWIASREARHARAGSVAFQGRRIRGCNLHARRPRMGESSTCRVLARLIRLARHA